MANIPLDQRLVVALDVPDRAAAIDLVQRTRDVVQHYKLGLELFIADGQRVLQWLREQDLQVFLDLKLHDIPNTMQAGVRQIARHGLSLTTLHGLAGTEALRAAKAALHEQTTIPGTEMVRLIGVTVLTHHEGQGLVELGLGNDVAKVQTRLTDIVIAAGLDGVVCAADEAAAVRQKAGEDFVIVCPGIRPEGSPRGDQKRTATPYEAAKAGADYLVIGRPIRASAEPAKLCAEILADISKGRQDGA